MIFNFDLPLSGTLPTFTLVRGFELLVSGASELIFLTLSKSLRADKTSAALMCENFEVAKLVDEMASATYLGIFLALSDQENDCKVALNRVLNIVLRNAYSPSNCLAI